MSIKLVPLNLILKVVMLVVHHTSGRCASMVGRADMNKPGSWNAYVDYKYFAHGSFFGGNGTEAVPDRYLDGIKSFTFGGGMYQLKIYFYKHSIHLMQKGSTNEIPYMDLKTSNLGIILVSK